MRILREDPYKVYRAVWAVIGFATPVIPLSVFVQRHALTLEDSIWLVGLSIALPVSLIASYRWEYLAIDESILSYDTSSGAKSCR